MADVMKNDKAWNPPTQSQREDIPSHVFLVPSEKKYPYKKYVDGEWKVSCAGLLAAYRRAIMNNDASVEQKAKSLATQYKCGWASRE